MSYLDKLALMMKIELQREALLSGLQMLSGLFDKNQNMPILEFVLCRLQQQKLQLIATDLEMEMICEIPLIDAVSTHEISEFTLPGKKTFDIVKLLPDVPITIETQEQNLLIKTTDSEFRLAHAATNDFPVMQTDAAQIELQCNAEELVESLSTVSFTMALQDVRFYLNGVLCEINAEGIRFVASDGHRLALIQHKEKLAIAPTQFILPRKTVIELERLLAHRDEKIAVNVGKKNIKFIAAGLSISSTLIDSRYPNYLSLLPKPGEMQVQLNKAEFKSVLQRAAVFSIEKLNVAKFQLENNVMTIHAQSANADEARIEMSVAYTAKPIHFAFNLHYLLDVLHVLPEQNFTLHICEPNLSAYIQSEKTGASYIIMPMRL